MEEAVARFLTELRDLPGFADIDVFDVNACAIDGDNALHVAVRRNDVSMARALIDAGIDVNKHGDLGYTPLHAASMDGNRDIVELLVARGADLFALSEGYPPFTTARLAGQDHICELLGSLMKRAQETDPKIWVVARMRQLKRQLANLEARLNA
jgi:hypothetical protein